ncbi:MAG: hypothetical protein JWP81_1549 [Ferruginibacter sp.]|nr:hypothetical protein [Ferruginibacter sp.]
MSQPLPKETEFEGNFNAQIFLSYNICKLQSRIGQEQ